MSTALRDFLPQRHQELVDLIDLRRRELAPLEAELTEVEQAMRSLGMAIDREPTRRALAAEEFDAGPDNPYDRMSMKQLTVRALKMEFRSGATAKELLRFFHQVWKRADITRESLSPQLSRLKSEGVLRLEGKHWFLMNTIPRPGEYGSPDDGEPNATQDKEKAAGDAPGQDTPAALFPLLQDREAGPGGGT